MPLNYLTLSRQDLNDLVWSKPMTEVAASLGVSDVALAKRCAAVGIPVPPRGYWARVQAGQTPRKPPLPVHKRSGSHTSESVVHVPKRDPDPPPPPKAAPTASELAIRSRVNEWVPLVPMALDNPHPAVKRRAVELKF